MAPITMQAATNPRPKGDWSSFSLIATPIFGVVLGPDPKPGKDPLTAAEVIHRPTSRSIFHRSRLDL
jgi:hypothetical protein